VLGAQSEEDEPEEVEPALEPDFESELDFESEPGLLESELDPALESDPVSLAPSPPLSDAPPRPFLP
jgi:hypothetical protein